MIKNNISFKEGNNATITLYFLFIKNGKSEQVIQNTGNINNKIQIVLKIILFCVCELFVTISFAIKYGMMLMLAIPSKKLYIDNSSVIIHFLFLQSRLPTHLNK